MIARKNDEQPVLLYVGLGLLLLVGGGVFLLRKKKEVTQEKAAKLSPEQVGQLNELIFLFCGSLLL